MNIKLLEEFKKSELFKSIPPIEEYKDQIIWEMEVEACFSLWLEDKKNELGEKALAKLLIH